MNFKEVKSKEEVDLIKRGWQTLVKGLGHLDATRFVVTLERTTEDSIDEIAKYWGDKTIDDIHNLIMQVKKSGQI